MFCIQIMRNFHCTYAALVAKTAEMQRENDKLSRHSHQCCDTSSESVNSGWMDWLSIDGANDAGICHERSVLVRVVEWCNQRCVWRYSLWLSRLYTWSTIRFQYSSIPKRCSIWIWRVWLFELSIKIFQQPSGVSIPWNVSDVSSLHTYILRFSNTQNYYSSVATFALRLIVCVE